MNQDTNGLRVSAFSAADAIKIATWPADAQELAAWAGRDAAIPISPDQIRLWQSDPDVDGFVGVLNETLIAYGELWTDRDENEIELARIIVHPQHRGMGVGRSFVRKLAERARAKGAANTVIIRVVAENGAAIRCYQSAGFESIQDTERDEFNEGQPRCYEWFRLRPS